MTILRRELGGGSVVIDYKNQTVTFEEDVDAALLSNYEIMDCLMFDIIWRGLREERKSAPYHEGHGIGIRIRDGWVVRNAHLFYNCVLLDYINIIPIGNGNLPIYIEGKRAEVVNRRILIGRDQNVMVYCEFMNKPEDYQYTFIAPREFDLNTYKAPIYKLQALYVPINYGV